MSVEFNPIVVPVPITDVMDGSSSVRILVPANVITQRNRVIRIDGFLEQLVVGPFSVEIRDLHDNTLINTLTWNAPGSATTDSIDYTMDQSDSGFLISVVAFGVGARSVVLTLWNRMEF
jgi:hypothetical protein